MSEHLNFFVPIINAPFKIKSVGMSFIASPHNYEAGGYFQRRKAFIVTNGFSFFKKKFSVSEVSVELRNYKVKPFQKGFLGVSLEYEGNKYLVDNYLDGSTRLKSKTNRAINKSDDLLGAVKNQLQLLCNLAEKIDNGEIKCDSLLENSSDIN